MLLIQEKLHIMQYRYIVFPFQELTTTSLAECNKLIHICYRNKFCWKFANLLSHDNMVRCGTIFT